MNYTIKEATLKDVPLALSFRRKLFSDMGVSPEALRSDEQKLLFSIYEEAYKNDEIIHYIAYDESGTPVASAGALLKRDFPYLLFNPGYYGWIIDVYTEPPHRGNKLATILLERTHAWLKSKGAHEAKLISVAVNARKLYVNMGYRPTFEMSCNLTGEPTYNEIIDSHIDGDGI